MNLFFIDSNPYLAALWHGDKHVTKMILETAQMLSTAHHVCYGDSVNPLFYKPTHSNHPCSKWIRENTANYNWAWRLLDGLCMEFRIRRYKEHATKQLLYPLKTCPDIPVAKNYTMPALAMPDEFKTDDPVESYRNYYRHKFSLGIVSYNWSKNRDLPVWIHLSEKEG